MSRWASRNKARAKANRKQKGLCFWCGTPMIQRHELNGHAHAKRVTAEHVIPQSEGGTIIVAACHSCNQTRRNTPLNKWLARVKFRLNKEGNPSWFEVILSNLKELGIPPSLIGHPGNGPDHPPPSPPPKDE